MRRLSLCLIARDEEQLLPGCLASVASAVDELVVVDTGSRDATVSIARRAGAQVFEVPWQEDFSAPRNRALEQSTGDFVLVLDADERLAPGAEARLRAAVEGGGFDCGLVRLHNAARLDADPAEVIAGRARLGPPILLPRVLRRTAGLRYTGVVHESVSDWVAAHRARVVALDVDLVHLGAVPDLRAQRDKHQRNLRLLRRRCDLEPDSITPLAYLALELLGQGARSEAAAAAERGWALLDRQPADCSVLRLAVARAIVSVEADQPERALEAVDLAERREGPQPDLHHLRGRALIRLALRASGEGRSTRLSQAEAAFRAAQALAGREGVRQYVAGASSWASWNGRGEVRLISGDAAGAQSAFAEAMSISPSDLDARLGEAEALLGGGRPAEALAHLEPLLDQSPDGWLLAGVAARLLGAAGDARLLFGQAGARQSAGFRAPHRAARFAAIAAEIGLESG